MSLKNRLEELAIFGGRSAFGEKLHVGRPNIAIVRCCWHVLIIYWMRDGLPITGRTCRSLKANWPR